MGKELNQILRNQLDLLPDYLGFVPTIEFVPLFAVALAIV